jgi:hypothetical protein
MTQTIFAIIALIILSLFVYSERRSNIQTQTIMIEQAVGAIGSGVAVSRLNEIRTYSYDQATEETYIDYASQLTQPALFGPGQDAENDDIDDFDGAVTDIYRVVGTDTLTFRAESFVAYADEGNPSQLAPTGTRTKFKQVTVKVYNLNIADPDTLLLSQTISCKNACNW